MGMAMDVGNVEKVNLMIKELTKHGRVGSFDAALYEAQRLYSDNAPSHVHESSSESGVLLVEQEQASSNRIRQQMQQSSEIDEAKLNKLLREKLGAVLSAYHEGVMSEFRVMKDNINSLQKEISRLKSLTLQNPERQHEQQKLVPDEQLSESGRKENSRQYNERQGKYTSEDVSIEKMFYFGNK